MRVGVGLEGWGGSHQGALGGRGGVGCCLPGPIILSCSCPPLHLIVSADGPGGWWLVRLSLFPNRLRFPHPFTSLLAVVNLHFAMFEVGYLDHITVHI